MTILRAGNQQSNPKGFTLIELLIGLVLIGLLMGLVIGQVGKLLDSEMKHAANRLASTIRYLYNKSVSEGMILRLVLDMEETKYWVESTSGPFTLMREEETFFEKKPRTKNQEPRTEEDKEGKSQTLQPKEAVFTPEASTLLKPVTLPKGIYFKDIYAEHQIERLDSGQAFVYFFPRGYAERSVINLRDRDDKTHYSLEINPVTGAVKIEKGYKEPEIER